jgi:hypothetical protein
MWRRKRTTVSSALKKVKSKTNPPLDYKGPESGASTRLGWNLSPKLGCTRAFFAPRGKEREADGCKLPQEFQLLHIQGTTNPTSATSGDPKRLQSAAQVAATQQGISATRTVSSGHQDNHLRAPRKQEEAAACTCPRRNPANQDPRWIGQQCRLGARVQGPVPPTEASPAHAVGGNAVCPSPRFALVQSSWRSEGQLPSRWVSSRESCVLILWSGKKRTSGWGFVVWQISCVDSGFAGGVLRLSGF